MRQPSLDRMLAQKMELDVTVVGENAATSPAAPPPLKKQYSLDQMLAAAPDDLLAIAGGSAVRPAFKKQNSFVEATKINPPPLRKQFSLDQMLANSPQDLLALSEMDGKKNVLKKQPSLEKMVSQQLPSPRFETSQAQRPFVRGQSFQDVSATVKPPLKKSGSLQQMLSIAPTSLMIAISEANNGRSPHPLDASKVTEEDLDQLNNELAQLTRLTPGIPSAPRTEFQKSPVAVLRHQPNPASPMEALALEQLEQLKFNQGVIDRGGNVLKIGRPPDCERLSMK